MDFDPAKQVTFRGKRLAQLSHGETLEALISALKRVHYLEAIAGGRHQGGWPVFGSVDPEQGALE